MHVRKKNSYGHQTVVPYSKTTLWLMGKNAISHAVDMAQGCHEAVGLVTSLCHIHRMGYCSFLHQPSGLVIIFEGINRMAYRSLMVVQSRLVPRSGWSSCDSTRTGMTFPALQLIPTYSSASSASPRLVSHMISYHCSLMETLSKLFNVRKDASRQVFTKMWREISAR